VVEAGGGLGGYAACAVDVEGAGARAVHGHGEDLPGEGDVGESAAG